MSHSAEAASPVTARANRGSPQSSSTHRPRRSTSGDRVLPEGDDNRAIYPSLRGKKVLITGGGSGIGAGIVEAFARQGCDVTFIDILNGESEAHAAKTGSKFERVDLTDTAAATKIIRDLVEEHGPFDVLVNNAVHDDRHMDEAVTTARWGDRLNVNCKPHFLSA